MAGRAKYTGAYIVRDNKALRSLSTVRTNLNRFCKDYPLLMKYLAPALFAFLVLVLIIYLPHVFRKRSAAKELAAIKEAIYKMAEEVDRVESACVSVASDIRCYRLMNTENYGPFKSDSNND